MTIRRFDHRARFDPRIHNDTVKAIQATNRLLMPFAGTVESAGYTICARLKHDLVEVLSPDAYQWDSASNTYAWVRGTLPEKTISGARRYNIHSRANWLRYMGRGAYDWGLGWTGYDTSNVTDSDLLFGTSPYRLTGASSAGQAAYLDDAYVGFDYPDAVTIDPGLLVGTDQARWVAAYPDVYDAAAYNIWTWQRYVDDPTGIGWVNGWDAGAGQYENFPISASGVSGFNYCGSLFENPPVDHMVMESGLEVSVTPFVFCGAGVPDESWLALCPDGTTILDARIEVKSTSLVRVRRQVTREIVGGVAVVTSAVDTTTLEDMRYVLMGRKVEMLNGDRVIRWDYIGSTVPATASDGLWHVATCTDLVQTLITTIRKGEYSAFALVPAVYQEFFVGDVTDMRSFLQSLLPTMTYSYYYDPSYSGAFRGGGDVWYISEQDGTYCTWDSVDVGNMIVEFQYPNGERGRVVLGTSVVRCDSPSLGT